MLEHGYYLPKIGSDGVTIKYLCDVLNNKIFAIMKNDVDFGYSSNTCRVNKKLLQEMFWK